MTLFRNLLSVRNRNIVAVSAFPNAYSVSFDNTADASLDVSDNTDFNHGGDNFTIALWAKNNQADILSSDLFGKFRAGGGRREFNYTITASETIRVQVSTDGTGVSATEETDSAISNIDTWQFYAAVFQPASPNISVDIYLNGSVLTSSTTTGSMPASIHEDDAPFNIGNNFAGNSPWDGFIDEVSWWNTALSASDLLSLYNSGSPKDLLDSDSYDTDRTGNLIGWWRCGDDDGGSGSTVTDASTNSNDASLGSGNAFDSDVP